jgi:hypothetical protein
VSGFVLVCLVGCVCGCVLAVFPLQCVRFLVLVHVMVVHVVLLCVCVCVCVCVWVGDIFCFCFLIKPRIPFRSFLSHNL